MSDTSEEPPNEQDEFNRFVIDTPLVQGKPLAWQRKMKALAKKHGENLRMP